MNTQSRLQKLIHDSELTKSEAEEFFELLCMLKEDANVIAELFEEDLAWIPWLYENYKLKTEAFKTGDSGKLESILEEEKELFVE